MERWGRRLALVAALVGFAALALQLGIIVVKEGQGGLALLPALGAGLWRFVGYFTILGNMFAAVVALAMALAPRGALAGARVKLAAVVAIVLIGIVYSLLLRHVWNPTGWQAVADHALHDVMPPLFLLAWALMPHGGLAFRDALWAMVPPLGYLAYAMARGAYDGWYAYWFLDPAKLGPERMALNALALAAGFLAAGLLLVALDRFLARRLKGG
jgi:hypothetical protein